MSTGPNPISVYSVPILPPKDLVREPLTHNSGVPPIASQHNFIVQPLVTKKWNARIF